VEFQVRRGDVHFHCLKIICRDGKVKVYWGSLTGSNPPPAASPHTAHHINTPVHAKHTPRDPANLKKSRRLHPTYLCQSSDGWQTAASIAITTTTRLPPPLMCPQVIPACEPCLSKAGLWGTRGVWEEMRKNGVERVEIRRVGERSGAGTVGERWRVREWEN